MNIPNTITVFRLILVPVLVIFLLSGRYLEAFIVFSVASFTDYLDGHIARKYKKVTEFGKFIDPLADKALVMSAYICFVDLKEVNAVAVILMLVREFAVISVRLVASGGGRVIAANFWGKAKTIIQIFSILFIILLLSIKSLNTGIICTYEHLLICVKEIFLWLSVALSWISGLIYVYQNYDLIKDVK